MCGSSISLGIFKSQVLPRHKYLKSGVFVFLNAPPSDIQDLLIREQCSYSIGLKSLIQLLKDNNYDVYARDVKSFIFAYFFRNLLRIPNLIHYDFRGLISAESFLRNRSRTRKYFLESVEKFVFERSDRIFTVSHALKKHLTAQYGVRPIQVIPCLVELPRDFPAVGGRPLNSFVYIGSLSAWQGIVEALRLFKDLDLPGKSLTIFTEDLEQAQRLAARHGVEASVSQLGDKTFGDVLKNYEFGFVLRPDNVVNRTASPVKFLEYCSCGVIPICSPNLGDYSEIFKDCSVQIPEGFDIETVLEKFENLDREDLRKRVFALSSQFDWKLALEHMEY